MHHALGQRPEALLQIGLLLRTWKVEAGICLDILVGNGLVLRFENWESAFNRSKKRRARVAGRGLDQEGFMDVKLLGLNTHYWYP